MKLLKNLNNTEFTHNDCLNEFAEAPNGFMSHYKSLIPDIPTNSQNLFFFNFLFPAHHAAGRPRPLPTCAGNVSFHAQGQA